MNTTSSNIFIYENWTDLDLNITNIDVINNTGEVSHQDPAWQTWLDVSQIVISIIGMKVFSKLDEIKILFLICR